MRNQNHDLGLTVMNCLLSPPHHCPCVMLKLNPQPKCLQALCIRLREVIIYLLLQYPQGDLDASKASHPHLEFSFLSCWLQLTFSSIISLFFLPILIHKWKEYFFSIGEETIDQSFPSLNLICIGN